MVKNKLCFFVLLLFTSVRAATLNSDGSVSNTQAQINAAGSGDTVLLPAGQSKTWTASLTVNKGVTLDFNGCTITRSFGTNTPMIVVKIASGVTRLTGGTFSGGASQDGYGAAYLEVSGSTSGTFRIDHCTFNDAAGDTHVKFHDGVKGLFDHCTINCTQGTTEALHNEAYGASGTVGWSINVVPGSDDAVYVEDCTFNMDIGQAAGANSAMQNYYGARTVFRHNTIRNANFDNHGTPGNIGGRWWEVYDNTWIATQNLAKCMQLRAGSGVIFNNIIRNDPGAAGGRGISLEEEDSGSYPLLYQVGRGKNQVLDPAYVWDNGSKNNGGGMEGMSVGSQDPPIHLGRDYFTTARPGYTPYTYPHPLTQGGVDPKPTPTPGPVPTPTPPAQIQIGDVMGLQEALDRKSDKGHTHAIPAGQTGQ